MVRPSILSLRPHGEEDAAMHNDTRFHHHPSRSNWNPANVAIMVLITLLFLVFVFLFLTLTATPASGQNVPSTVVQAASMPQYTHSARMNPATSVSPAAGTAPAGSECQRPGPDILGRRSGRRSAWAAPLRSRALVRPERRRNCGQLKSSRQAFFMVERAFRLASKRLLVR
jgi:hypothetical protein